MVIVKTTAFPTDWNGRLALETFARLRLFAFNRGKRHTPDLQRTRP